MKVGLVWILGLLWIVAAGAADRVHVLALFPDRAMIEVDGKRKVLYAGRKAFDGVRLLSADSRRARLEVNGVEQLMLLGGSIGGTYRPPEQSEVRIARNNAGMFTTTGSINGQMVDFIVDTGASAVAISQQIAQRLGIDFRYEGRRGKVETASGRANAHFIMLDQVKVGSIERRNIRALVVEGGDPKLALLGMSFLKGLDMENSGPLMVLRQTR